MPYPCVNGVRMDSDAVREYIAGIPDEVLTQIQFSVPWQYSEEDSGYADPDFPDRQQKGPEAIGGLSRTELQLECWSKFNRNPQFNTAVRGLVGRLAGNGFSVTCDILEIQRVIDEIVDDWRNRIYHFLSKWVTCSYIDGELFLLFTCHKDGFIEIDYVDPNSITGSSDKGEGILWHPRKALLPVVYCMKDNSGGEWQVPSIYVARDPSIINEVRSDPAYNQQLMNKSRNWRLNVFKPMGGYYRFMVAWDKGHMTTRAVSHLRTVLEWLNYYENLKKYEIDHKKSAGAYLWVCEIEEPRAFRAWIALSDDDKRKTGIGSKKTPGSTIVLPPGMKLTAQNPHLPKISESDTDIMQMIISGLNEAEDVTMGRSRSSYSSTNASRGPMSDRVSDEIAYFSRFLQNDFWGSIFFLKSQINNFPETFKVKQAVGFKDRAAGSETDPDPIFEQVEKRPDQLIELNFPTSEIVDYESRAKAFMGVKHGNTYDTLGLPNSEIAKKLGFNNYKSLRLIKATEENKYPLLIAPLDDEAVQESIIEPSPKKLPRRTP